MTFQLVHLIGQPPEQLADVLRAELNQENLVQSIESNNIAQASPIITSALPDLVVPASTQSMVDECMESLKQLARVHLGSPDAATLEVVVGSPVGSLEGYAEPKNYHVRFNDRRLMKLGKMKSLSEANDVFVNKRRNGKLRTIHLEVIKVIDDRTRTRTRRSGGVD